MRPVMLDCCVPVPRSGFGAAYIEHKVMPRKLDAEQIAVSWALVRAGNAVRVSYCFEDSQAFLTAYLTTGRVGDIGVERIPDPAMRNFQIDLDETMKRR